MVCAPPWTWPHLLRRQKKKRMSLLGAGSGPLPQVEPTEQEGLLADRPWFLFPSLGPSRAAPPPLASVPGSLLPSCLRSSLQEDQRLLNARDTLSPLSSSTGDSVLTRPSSSGCMDLPLFEAQTWAWVRAMSHVSCPSFLCCGALKESPPGTYSLYYPLFTPSPCLLYPV